MIDPNKTLESEAIFLYVERRLKKRLGVNILMVGGLGSGKSYAGLRFCEKWYGRYFGERFPIEHVTDDLSQAILTVKDFKRPGEPILVEEISVHAGSRESLTRQNRLWNKFMDTCRIKQAIVIMNGPALSFIDKHIVLLCNILIETLGVNFRKEIVVFKAKWLQFSQYKKEPYTHLFVNREGYPIDIFYLKKPSKELCEAYDSFKDRSVHDLYDEIAQRMQIERKQQLKVLGKKILTDKEQRVYDLILEGHSQKEIATKLNITQPAVSYFLKQAKDKIKSNNLKPLYKENKVEDTKKRTTS
jgi:DNA-binding CsgD family transcriptional regulator